MKKKRSYKDALEYKQWKTIVIGSKTFPTEKFFEQVSQDHKARKSRRLAFGKSSARKIQEASAQDVDLRGRIIDYRTKAMRIYYALTTANEAMRDYLLTHGDLQGRTVEERRRAAENILRNGRRCESDLDSFLDVMKEFLDDIDQAGWSMKRMLDAIQINSRPENLL